MDMFVDFLTSVNKIAVLAFFSVIVFLIFEFYQLEKERRKKTKPVIPQFSENLINQHQEKTLQQVIKKNATTDNKNFRVLSILGAFTLLLLLVGYIAITVQKIYVKKNTKAQRVSIIQEIASEGVRIFTTKWLEIGKDTKMIIRPGDMLYIGIQTIPEADIDRARIRVNEKQWQVKHITTLFNKQKDVYYKEYSVATGESQLKIDAQLHSANDGWLGE